MTQKVTLQMAQERELDPTSRIVVVVTINGRVAMQLPIDHCGEGIGPPQTDRAMIRQALLDAVASLG
jgi:hypothetical protein